MATLPASMEEKDTACVVKTGNKLKFSYLTDGSGIKDRHEIQGHYLSMEFKDFCCKDTILKLSCLDDINYKVSSWPFTFRQRNDTN